MRFRSAVLGGIAAAPWFATLAGCAGNGSTTTPIRTASFAAATSSVCVPASTVPQTVSLPATGGVSASVALGAYDAGSSGCQDVTIATGSDAEAALSASSAFTSRRTSAARASASATAPAPIITITLGAGLPASSRLGLSTIFVGATLTTDPNLHVPNGTYLATLTFNGNTYSLVFTANGGVLTLTGGLPAPLLVGASSTLAIYNRGVTPPGFDQSIPTPAPSISPSPVATASPVPSPTPTASSGTTVYGAPPPVAGTTLGTLSYMDTSACPAGYPYQCSESNIAVVQQSGGGSSDGATDVSGSFPAAPIFTGVVTISYDLRAFVAASSTNDCPSQWSVSAGAASIVVNIPVLVYPAQQPRCTITLSTAPANATGTYSYYTQSITI